MKSAGGGTGDGDGAGASGREGDQWTLFIDLPVLEAATASFSDRNLLGRGGFGPVYKGVMEGGQEIAVKRLSLESRQGVREFLNEVRLLLKVQHRNLVSLLGCCAAAGQKMLVYPYFPNGSLDHILFDDKDEIASADSVKFQSVFSQVETLHQHVQKPREQIADAGAFLDITTSLAASVRSQSALGIIPGHLQL